MKRGTFLLALALCVLAAVLAGCGRKEKRVAEPPHRLVAVLFTDSAETFRRNGRALQDVLKKDGFDVELDFADTAEEQARQFRQVLDKKPVAVVVGAVDGDALKDVLAEAANRKIPVIAYDRLIMNSPHVSYFVGFDAKEIGRIQAQTIEVILRLYDKGDSATIEIFAGDDKDRNAHLFYDGSMEILRPYLASGRLVVPSGETSFEQTMTAEWSAANAKKRMDRILQTVYADGRMLDAVLSPNDTLESAISESLETYYKDRPWPFLTGLDADPKNVHAIALDKQGMTLDKPPSLLVGSCMRLIRAISDKQTVTAPATQNNGARDVPAFLSKPIIVAKDKVDADAPLQGNP